MSPNVLKKGRKMDKIYSRRRIKLPNYKNLMKASKIICIVSIAIVTAYAIVKAISPIIDKQCINMAKSIATKISNEQATIVMSKYKYDDLCNITKDSNRKYIND